MSVDPASVPGDCVRAFVDVFSNTEMDKGALICCPVGYEQRGLLGICDKTVSSSLLGGLSLVQH
jgi:hypothetical protein